MGTPLGAPGHQVPLGGLCVEATCCILLEPGAWETVRELLGTTSQEACRDSSSRLWGDWGDWAAVGGLGGLGTWVRED